MKVLDVESLHNGIDQSVNDIGTVQEQIEAIQRAVRDFQSLDDALRGQGGEAIRSFYQDTHEPFLIYLHQSLTDYENLLKEMKDAIDSFESNASGYVSQEYLESDVNDGFDKVETQAVELTEDANTILEDVEDIVAVTKIDESDVIEEVQRGKDKAENIVDELIILDDYETSQLEQPKQNLQTMRTFLTDIESKFKSGTLSIKNYDVKAIQDLTAYNAILDGIDGEEHPTISAAYGENMEELPMSEIEKGKDAALDQLTEDGKRKVNQAFIDLENGVIDRAEYAGILKDELAKGIEEGTMDEGFFSGLVDYLDENKESIIEDASKSSLVATLEQLGVVTYLDGQRIINKEAIMGPVGDKSFVMMSEETADKVAEQNKTSSQLKRAGKYLGRGFMVAGFGMGMYDDMTENNKTAGEAIAHNGASLGAGALATAGTAILLGSNPVGWALVGTVAIGVAASVLFEFAYDSNFLGLQDGLDWTGDKLSEGAGWVADKAVDAWNGAGEAISSGLDAINPMNWGWG